MADLLYIANAALSMVGQGTILSLDDGTQASKTCKLHIYQAVREVLALGKWKCAKKQANLAQLTAAPLFGWAYAYTLPADFVRVVSLNDTDTSNVLRVPYDIQGANLLTDQALASLTYVADLSAAPNDIGLLAPYLVECISVKLAQKMAWPFQQARTLRESLEQEYQAKRRQALAADAKETRDLLPNPAAESTWLRTRFSSTAG